VSFLAAALLFLALRPLQVEHYYRIESAEEPALAPDGRLVVFTRRFVDEQKNVRRSELWVVPADGSEPPRRLTQPALDASSPRFSPDGKLLVFQSRRPGSDSSIWFLRTDGFGEAFQIDSVEELPELGPDGRSLAFVKRTPPEGKRPERGEREKKIEGRFEGKIYDWTQFRFDRRGYLPDPKDPWESPPKELYVVSLDARGEASEPRRITSLGVDVTAMAWSPDATRLVAVADLHQRDESVYERSDLWLVDASGREDAVRLTDDGFEHGSPVFSPDGTRIAYLRERGLSLLIAEKAKAGAPVDLVVMDLETRKTTNVTSGWDLRPESPVFSADGASLIFEAEVSGGRHLFRAPADGKGEVKQLTEGERQLRGVSFDGGREWMAYSVESSSAPPDVFVARVDGSSEKRLSTFGADSVAPYSLSSHERLVFPSRDGTSIEGWVLLPKDYDPSVRWPLVLAIHGGPHGAYGHRFSFPFHLWAASGYVVLYANPRGSTGYGESFLWATWGGGWGNLDSEDVLAGVDHVRSRFSIDESRMGVTGYSYGGFLTNWIIAHDTRFAAAVVGAGISNWVSDYGTADIPRTKESEFFGPPWEDKAGRLLMRQSPIHYVQNVTTPTLFVHGEIDYRVPIEQGEQMYTALKKRGIPAKFVRYPDSYHGGWTPWNMVHRYHHELSWWERYLGAPDGS
jgi:dipeptidyl aminopeptidase/acylaminoacyl peptidase